jgi:hypothetical protein
MSYFLINPKILKKSFFLLWLSSFYSHSAPFEIKVHDELIAEYQQSAYEIETNLYPTLISPNQKANVFQTRLEYGYGIAQNSELGINVYLSNYNGDNFFNGGKISHLYVPTHDENGLWHYGVKNEINYIKDIGGEETVFYEFTPIFAVQLQDWRFVINPSVDVTLNKTSYMSFSPSAKLTHSYNHKIDLGIEYYTDNLPIKSLSNISQQPNTAYLVTNVKHGTSLFHFGIGKGLTSSSDSWVLKMIASFNFD